MTISVKLPESSQSILGRANARLYIEIENTGTLLLTLLKYYQHRLFEKVEVEIVPKSC